MYKIRSNTFENTGKTKIDNIGRITRFKERRDFSNF